MLCIYKHVLTLHKVLCLHEMAFTEIHPWGFGMEISVCDAFFKILCGVNNYCVMETILFCDGNFLLNLQK